MISIAEIRIVDEKNMCTAHVTCFSASGTGGMQARNEDRDRRAEPWLPSVCFSFSLGSGARVGDSQGLWQV